MGNVAIKGRGGNDVQHKNWKGKILRIWITIIRHGGLGPGGYCHIWAIWVCAAVKGMVFKQFTLG